MDNPTAMDTDQPEGPKGLKNVGATGASGVEVSLHPMVILNISECHTRLKIQCPNQKAPLFGAIIGKHQGRKIEILNSYELPLVTKSSMINASKLDINVIDANIADVKDEVLENEPMDDSREAGSSTLATSSNIGPAKTDDCFELFQEYFEEKVEQYKQVFPDYELVGWFSVGDEVDDFDRSMFGKVGKIHGKGSEKFTENPLVLKLNPSKVCTKTLPVRVYESYLKTPISVPFQHVLPEVCFTEVQVSLETEDGEKIALDHVAENQNSAGVAGNSSVSDRFRIQSRAVRMLRDRIKTIVDFVDDAERNGIVIDQEILRQISFIANRLPMCSLKGEFESDLNVLFNDNALLIYLGTLTKCSATINRYVSRLNSFMPDRVLRRRNY